MTLPAALKIKPMIAPIRPGSTEAAFTPSVLRPSPIFSPFFHSIGDCPKNSSNCGTRGKKDGGYCHAIFFENFFYFFSKRHGSFSFLNLSLQPRNLFVPLCYSCLCCFFVLGEGVFIIDSCLIFFIFLFKFFFMLINFF